MGAMNVIIRLIIPSHFKTLPMYQAIGHFMLSRSSVRKGMACAVLSHLSPALPPLQAAWGEQQVVQVTACLRFARRAG
jgi:hypothetical protein